MNVFNLRDRLVADYGDYVRSFISIRDEHVRRSVDEALDQGLLWPEPRVGLNPSFEAGRSIDELVGEKVLHPEAARVFKIKSDGKPDRPLRLHRHQEDAVRAARTGASYVLTTGTGSGKSLAYIVPIVDHVLRSGSKKKVQAIVVYPMNALANSQFQELEKFLKRGYPDGRGPVRFAKYTGQESEEERAEIIADPPDILLTNYVMLELLLTRVVERNLVTAADGLRFLVLDELHTYRGRQGADVALLVRRVREACKAHQLQCVGTSATLAGPGSLVEQRTEVARVASLLFGTEIRPDNVIGETLRRVTTRRIDDGTFLSELATAVDRVTPPEDLDYNAFAADPLSSWVEQALGLDTDPNNGQLVRRLPRTLHGPDGVAPELAVLTARSVEFTPGGVRIIAGSDLSGASPPLAGGRTVDAAGYFPLDAANPNAGYIPFGIEVKNIRSWIYPWDNEMWDLLSALASRPDVVPVLVARRIHPISFNFLKDVGGLAHPTFRQWFAWSGTTDDSLTAERFAEVVEELGFHDAERVLDPNDPREPDQPAMPAAHLLPTASRRPPPEKVNAYTNLRPAARFFRFTLPREIRQQAERWEQAAPLAADYKELREPNLPTDKRHALWAEFAQRVREAGLYERKQWGPPDFNQ